MLGLGYSWQSLGALAEQPGRTGGSKHATVNLNEILLLGCKHLLWDSRTG